MKTIKLKSILIYTLLALFLLLSMFIHGIQREYLVWVFLFSMLIVNYMTIYRLITFKMSKEEYLPIIIRVVLIMALYMIYLYFGK